MVDLTRGSLPSEEGPYANSDLNALLSVLSPLHLINPWHLTLISLHSHWLRHKAEVIGGCFKYGGVV